jgi:hypothetical protein
MLRVTELVLVLCGAIVKTAFKLWAGNNSLVANVSGDLTDLVKSQVSGLLEQRKVRTQFGKMEEIVADQLLALLAAEFRNLDEGEKSAAIFAATETFDRAKLTDKALFAANLDPLYLTKTVLKFTGDATRDLSDAGVQLYYRLVAQCCAYVIEIADKLPRFQANAFSELLSRDAQIMARITEVLERLPAPTQDGDGADRVTTAYRQLIAKRFDRLELFGLDFAAQWYALSIAYVNLTMTARQAQPFSGGKDSEADHQTGEGTSEHSGQGSAVFADWLARYPRILIEGRAGGGKTTILQWAAVRAALRDFPGLAAEFNGYVPFFLRLRDYADGALPQPEQFLDKVASLLAPEAGSWPRDLLKSGRALVLVDGMDEVPEPRRPVVLAWLGELAGLFPEARYVVTTRPKALEQGALADAGFVQVNLEPMDPGLIRDFIDQWHAAMREWQKDADSLALLDECHSRLLNTLDNDRFLSDLANTPLLAGLICALNHHLNAQLPRRRSEIFQKALAMFHERDAKRGIPVALSLDLEATNHLLGDLALWMVRNARVEVAADDDKRMVAADSARSILRQSALSLPTRPTTDANLYEYLLERGGVLREPTDGQVDFVHRTFQEYLAAKALVRTDNVGEIVKNAGDDQWREVVILASGQGNVKQTTELLKGLTRPSLRGNSRYRRRLLAVACLDEIRAADPRVLADIDKAIPELLPPRDMDQAEQLSHAGERLISYLAKLAFADEQEMLPTIRAVSLIGGPTAYALLKDLALQIRSLSSNLRHSCKGQVPTEFVRAWRYFDPDQFATDIVFPFDVKEFRATDLWSLHQVAKLASVTTLTLALFPTEKVWLAAVDRMNVKVLNFEDCDFNSLNGVLRRWPQVTELRLERCTRLTDIGALSMLPNLQRLELVNCDPLTNLGPIYRHAKLQNLVVSYMPKVDLRQLVGKELLVNLHEIREVIYPDSSQGLRWRETTDRSGRNKAADAQHKAVRRAFG